MPKMQTSILLKQVKLVNESLKLTIISSVVLGSVLGLQIFKEFSTSFSFIWLSFLLVGIGFRIFLLLRNKSNPPNLQNIQTWLNLNYINTAISALAYSIAAGSTYWMKDQVAVTIIYIVSAGVSGGAVTAYGPVKNLSLVFILPVIVPLTVVNLFFGDLNHIILAVTTTLFCYIIYSTSNNLYKTFLNTLEQNNVIKNLTEEKVRMEEMAKLKSDFFASMSHEIRTPLNGIVGLVDLLLGSKIDESQKDYLKTIKGSSDDLLNVINDVLDLSKIESDKLELLPKNTSLSEFSKRMMILFSERAKGKNIKLKFTADTDLPNNILVDEHRLSQITSNLISNAIKFTDQGSVHFSINILFNDNNKVKLQFKVEDTGIGIAEEKQKTIFNKYDQIANSNNYLVTQVGTGLGLSIAKKLVTIMGGEIGVFSKEKQGSIFWFNIECPVLEIKKSGQSATIGKDKFNFNVLLVDDRDINLKVASLMLNKLGCRAETATNGEMAVEMYDEKPNFYDLIIMDIQMPIMDGITATQEIVKKYPNDHAPIYGLSAQVAKNLHASPEELGFDYYLTKPLSLESLKLSLTRLV